MLSDGYLPFLLLLVIVLLLAKPATSDEGCSCKHTLGKIRVKILETLEMSRFVSQRLSFKPHVRLLDAPPDSNEAGRY